MFGGLMKSTSRLALIAAAGLALGGIASAQAADLGGDCCADLEERVAELEATTARKGNRKVSLTVSGQVNELVWWWDDGVESNVYQGSSGFSSTRFRFRGDASINSDWSAGYYLEIEAFGAQVSAQNAANDDRTPTVNVRHSAWYLKSKTLGSLWVGQYSFATDDITAAIGLGGTASATQANLNSAPGASLVINGAGPVPVTVSNLLEFLDTDRGNLVRYDSPTIAGFVFSAAWGEDDFWDVALRYAGEWNSIKVAAAIGYHEEMDNNGDNGTANITRGGVPQDFDEVVGAISVLHEPSGLFIDFAGIHREFDSQTEPAFGPLPDFDYWYLRGGIYRKFIPLGKTSIFGEYAEATDGAVGNFALIGGGPFTNTITSSKIKVWGFGIQQQIDAAAMEIYLGYRRFESDVTTFDSETLEFTRFKAEDIDTVYSGARIQF